MDSRFIAGSRSTLAGGESQKLDATIDKVLRAHGDGCQHLFVEKTLGLTTKQARMLAYFAAESRCGL